MDICSLYLEAHLESAHGLLRKNPNVHVCSIAFWEWVARTNDTRRIWDHSKKLENRTGRTKREPHRSRPRSMCALEAPNLAKNHLRAQLKKYRKIYKIQILLVGKILIGPVKPWNFWGSPQEFFLYKAH